MPTTSSAPDPQLVLLLAALHVDVTGEFELLVSLVRTFRALAAAGGGRIGMAEAIRLADRCDEQLAGCAGALRQLLAIEELVYRVSASLHVM